MTVNESGHDTRCDSDLCHPDCPIRRHAVATDRPYPGDPLDRAAADDFGPAPVVYQLTLDEILTIAEALTRSASAKVMVSADGLAFQLDGFGPWSPPMGRRG